MPSRARSRNSLKVVSCFIIAPIDGNVFDIVSKGRPKGKNFLGGDSSVITSPSRFDEVERFAATDARDSGRRSAISQVKLCSWTVAEPSCLSCPQKSYPSGWRRTECKMSIWESEEHVPVVSALISSNAINEVATVT